jgi:Na+/H+ antiporter NhaD/arsenite permease-like protein
VERLRAFGNSSPDANVVALFALATAVMAVLMIVLSLIHWMKEYSGRQTWRTFLLSLGIVVVYYGILLRWFWDMIPNT